MISVALSEGAQAASAITSLNPTMAVLNAIVLDCFLRRICALPKTYEKAHDLYFSGNKNQNVEISDNDLDTIQPLRTKDLLILE